MTLQRLTTSRLAAIVLTIACAPVFGITIDDGVVPKDKAALIAPYMGDYQGQWNPSVTDEVTDGISRYQLDNPVMRLSLDRSNRLRVQFFMDRASAQADDELDLLGFGCRSGVGDVLELDTPRPPKKVDADTAPYPVLTAQFEFDWGNCPSRVYAVPSNHLELALLVDESTREYVVNLRLLKRMQPDNKIVMQEGGRQRVVKVRPKTDRRPGEGSVYNPPLEYCVLNEFGEVDKCFDRESELKRYIVPFPFPGFSALWWTKKTPDLKVVKGVKKTYHEAVFHRPIDAKP